MWELSADLNLLTSLALLLSGIGAGFVNTLAGGGGLFTLAVLLLMGIPADLANGTNRVSVAIQSLEGVRGFHKHKVLDVSAIRPLLLPTLSGSLIGTIAASWMPVALLKPMLLTAMIGMALILLFKPSVMTPSSDIPPLKINQSPKGWLALFAAGLYGGFVQGGVGFLLLLGLVGVLRYPLAPANALKLVCTAIFGTVALAIFAARGQVMWLPGLIITAGTLIGVRASVGFAVNAKADTLRIILLAAVIVACIGAYFK